MKKQNFFFKLWRILYPVAIHFGCLIFISILGMIVLALSISLQHPDISPFQMQSMLYTIYYRNAVMLTAVGNLIAIPFSVLFTHLDNKKYPVGNLLSKAKPITYVLPVVAGIAFCIFGNDLLSFLPLGNFADSYEDTATLLYGNNIYTELLCIAIIAPIGEEFFFRGLVYRRMRDYMPIWSSIILSALCFGVYHGNVVQGIYASILGCVLAYIYEKYQNLLAPILVHIAANVLSVIMSETTVFQFLFHSVGEILLYMIIALVVGMLVLFAIQYVVVVKRDVRPEMPIRITRRMRQAMAQMQYYYSPYPYYSPVQMAMPVQYYSQPMPMPPQGYPQPMPMPPQGYPQPMPMPPQGYAQPMPMPPQGYSQPMPMPLQGYSQPMPMPLQGYSQPMPMPPQYYWNPTVEHTSANISTDDTNDNPNSKQQ